MSRKKSRDSTRVLIQQSGKWVPLGAIFDSILSQNGTYELLVLGAGSCYCQFALVVFKNVVCIKPPSDFETKRTRRCIAFLRVWLKRCSRRDLKEDSRFVAKGWRKTSIIAYKREDEGTVVDFALAEKRRGQKGKLHVA